MLSFCESDFGAADAESVSNTRLKKMNQRFMKTPCQEFPIDNFQVLIFKTKPNLTAESEIDFIFSVLLIPNFFVLRANFSSKLNFSPRLRGATGFRRFFSVSPCLRGGFCFLVAALPRCVSVPYPALRSAEGVVGFGLWFSF